MKITKQRMIEDYLQEYGSISSMEAITFFWATRLSAIIYTLKAKGWRFHTQMETHRTGSKFARYYLISD